MIEATSQPSDRLCTACFTGSYPVELPEDGRIGKHVLETLPVDLRPARRDVDPDPYVVGVDGLGRGVLGGAENALLHP